MSDLLILWNTPIQRVCHHPRGGAGRTEHLTTALFFGLRFGSVPAVTASSNGRHQKRGDHATPITPRAIGLRMAMLAISALTGPWCVARSGLVGTVSADAQPAITAPSPATLLTPAQAMTAFEELSSLVVAMSPPEPGAFTSSGTPSAVCVTLRFEGRLIARATAHGPACLAQAARQAVDAMSPRAARLTSTPQPPQRPILPGLESDRVLVSLELAGPLVPFSPVGFDELDARLSPGLDGVAVRINERTEIFFPGAMLTLNISPGDAMASVIANATGDATLGVRGNPEASPELLAKTRGAVFYRFRVVHLANPEPRAPAVFLHRGGKIVRERDITVATLGRFADAMAQNLIERRTPQDGGHDMVGTPLPTLGRFEQRSASPVEQALAAFALARYADTRERGDAARTSARARVNEILDHLAVGGVGKADLRPGFACAALAVSAAGVPVELQERSEGLTPAARAFIDRCEAVLDSAATSIGAVPEPERSVVAFALACRAARRMIPADLGAADRAVREVLGRTPPSQLVNEMPWIGWADIAVADARDGAITSSAALREVRDSVYSHALSTDAAGPDAGDLVGGIVFSASGPPMPTWQSARPLAFLATMLGDRRLTDPGEVVKEQSRLLPSLRFLRQLQTDEAAGHMCLAPVAARGGIRAAVWDQRQPADATSLTLLTVCEALRSFDQ